MDENYKNAVFGKGLLRIVDDMLNEVQVDICNNYCKFPEMYGDDYEGKEKLLAEKCDKCTFMSLL